MPWSHCSDVCDNYKDCPYCQIDELKAQLERYRALKEFMESIDPETEKLVDELVAATYGKYAKALEGKDG